MGLEGARPCGSAAAVVPDMASSLAVSFRAGSGWPATVPTALAQNSLGLLADGRKPPRPAGGLPAGAAGRDSSRLLGKFA